MGSVKLKSPKCLGLKFEFNLNLDDVNRARYICWSYKIIFNIKPSDPNSENDTHNSSACFRRITKKLRGLGRERLSLTTLE